MYDNAIHIPSLATVSPSRRTRSDCEAMGFTLVELLVVIAIIGTLVGLLVPAVTKALDIAADSRTRARIHSIAQAVHQYKADLGYFPGQHPDDDLNNGGSAFLGQALFADVDTPSEKYLAYEEGIMATDNDWGPQGYPQFTLVDGTDDQMAICYYPSAPGQTGLSQYNEDNNEQYTQDNTGGDFNDFIEDERFDGTRPYKSGEFLLIAPGRDREYFTNDDITNW